MQYIEPRAPFYDHNLSYCGHKIVGWRELNPLPQYIACQV